MAAARQKMAVAFEFFAKLGTPYYCFHDRDVAPEGDRSPSSARTSTRWPTTPPGYQERTGVRLLWGTANLFSHPRYQAGAATNPDPEVFAYAAAQVKHMLEVTQRLGGAELRAVGRPRGLRHAAQHGPGREQATARPLPAPRRRAQAPDRLHGQMLIEPKPMEPTKHQYDYDVATVYGFLQRNGLEDEYKRQHRGQPRHARRPLASTTRSPSPSPTASSAASTRTAATRRTAGTPTSSRTRSRSWRCRMYEILRGGGLAHRRLQLRRQAAPPEHRPRRPVPRPHRRAWTRSPGRCWWRRR